MRVYKHGDYYPRNENECIILGQEGTFNAVIWMVNAFISRLNHESEQLETRFNRYAEKENDQHLIRMVNRLIKHEYYDDSLFDSPIDGSQASPMGMYHLVFMFMSRLRHEARYLYIVMREYDRTHGSEYGLALIDILNDARSEYED